HGECSYEYPSWPDIDVGGGLANPRPLVRYTKPSSVGSTNGVFEFQLGEDLRKKAAGKYVSPLELPNSDITHG
ncbi:MAG TPA: hypothetical protein VJQ54_15710, partial [Candidatus Sulfotelmatobacter sp.]|nr:hypothetical protein [Candidatus Sulfotelmatobacter sp.]